MGKGCSGCCQAQRETVGKRASLNGESLGSQERIFVSGENL